MHLSVRMGATSLEKETFGVVCARPSDATHSSRGQARHRCRRFFAGFHICPSLDPGWRPLYQNADLAVNERCGSYLTPPLLCGMKTASSPRGIREENNKE